MESDDSSTGKKWADQFIADAQCPECHGHRLNREALSYKIWDKNIAELSAMDITDLKVWVEDVEQHISEKQQLIAKEILKEIRKRINFLLDVGLDYLSLNRQSATLSGGESQRIRLATQIGSQLVNVLYILDEPTTGLHFEDIRVLMGVLQKLVDRGNTVVIIEHNLDVIKTADHIIDIGVDGGENGGTVVATGTPEEIAKSKKSYTGKYIAKILKKKK